MTKEERKQPQPLRYRPNFFFDVTCYPKHFLSSLKADPVSAEERKIMWDRLSTEQKKAVIRTALERIDIQKFIDAWLRCELNADDMFELDLALHSQYSWAYFNEIDFGISQYDQQEDRNTEGLE